jgi:hypothetical protein
MRKTTHRSRSGKSPPSKRGDDVELSPRVRETVDGLPELCDVIEAGIPPGQAARVRPSPVIIRIRPPDLKGDQIRAIRESLGLNQSLFAEFLGVKLPTLRSWEKGDTTPSPVARRFLKEIRGDPAYWLEKFKRWT